MTKRAVLIILVGMILLLSPWISYGDTEKLTERTLIQTCELEEIACPDDFVVEKTEFDDKSTVRSFDISEEGQFVLLLSNSEICVANNSMKITDCYRIPVDGYYVLALNDKIYTYDLKQSYILITDYSGHIVSLYYVPDKCIDTAMKIFGSTHKTYDGEDYYLSTSKAKEKKTFLMLHPTHIL